MKKKNILLTIGFIILLSLMGFNINIENNTNKSTPFNIASLNKTAMAGGEYCVGAYLINCTIYGETFIDYKKEEW